MCDCQTKIASKLAEMGLEAPSNLNIEILSGRTYSTWSGRRNGKKDSMPVLHSFCPHCGKPYKEDDHGKQENL